MRLQKAQVAPGRVWARTNLQKLQSNQLKDLAEFIVTENFKHHSNNALPEDYRNDVNSIYMHLLG